MKFGDVYYVKSSTRKKQNIWWHHYYDVFITSFCILSFIWLKKVENPNFFVFNPICLKFGRGSNFEMLITENNPKLRL